MKKSFVLLMIMAFTVSGLAQPQKISYQAVIRNSSGQLVSNHAVGMRISILQGSVAGTSVYVETQTPTTNTNGLATIEIGGGTIVSGTFAGINWASDAYFIKTETDPSGGTSYTITGTSQIVSVPYALYAKSAATAADAVTLTGDQTITGSKTFAKDILVNGLTVGKGGSGISTNTALGISALKGNTSGVNNTTLGSEALLKNTSGYSNTSSGFRSLYSNLTGWRNTAIGDSTLFSNTTGADNTATGAYALHLNTSGYWNTGNGYQSLVSNTTGIGNTAIGYKAFRSGEAGSYNTAVGYHAGYSNTAGSNNVFIGSSAGYYEKGSNRLFIDNQQRTNETNARNNALIYGIFNSDPGNQILTLNGNVGISSSNPGAKLEVSLQNPKGWSGNLKAIRISTPDLAYFLEISASIISAGNAGYNFNPNGNPGLTVSSPGNVGIGTSTPSTKLDVNGIVRISNGNDLQLIGATEDAGDVVFYSSAGAQLARIYTYYNSLVLTTQTNNTPNLIITQTGETSVTNHRIIEVADPVSAQDAATKAYIDQAIALGLIPNNYSGTMYDIDGNVYKIVTIGTQTWMAENLRTGRFSNGNPISLVKDASDWGNLTTSAYCYYNNEVLYKTYYGALYNYYAVSSGNLCPTNWHVPTQNEWNIMKNYLGGINTSISKLKESGTAHWNSPNTGANNVSGFTALPGGYRSSIGSFDKIGDYGFWYTSTELSSTEGGYEYLPSNEQSAIGGSFHKKYGFSVRCIKNQ